MFLGRLRIIATYASTRYTILTFFRNELVGGVLELVVAPVFLGGSRSAPRAAVLGMVTIGNRVTSAYCSTNYLEYRNLSSELLRDNIVFIPRFLVCYFRHVDYITDGYMSEAEPSLLSVRELSDASQLTTVDLDPPEQDTEQLLNQDEHDEDDSPPIQRDWSIQSRLHQRKAKWYASISGQ